jgi:hypothetical protein
VAIANLLKEKSRIQRSFFWIQLWKNFLAICSVFHSPGRMTQSIKQSMGWKSVSNYWPPILIKLKY